VLPAKADPACGKISGRKKKERARTTSQQSAEIRIGQTPINGKS
jgi:hypothetical protein